MSEIHQFGGPWTLLKLDALEAYLKAYIQVMKNQKFKLVYIDAFAGSGELSFKNNSATHAGSARRALETEGFNKYIFIEPNQQRYKQLHKLCDSYRDLRDTEAKKGDGNAMLREILAQYSSRDWRGVVFLDPYGLELQWSTLEHISQSGHFDVWYLFPLSGFYRNATNRWVNMDKSKEDALDRLLGTTEWRNAIYEAPRQSDLFAYTDLERNADPSALEAYFTDRLKTLFGTVLPPLRLYHHKTNAPMYSLYFMMSNTSEKAVGAASRIAGHILKNAK